jgi:hypothetical protein
LFNHLAVNQNEFVISLRIADIVNLIDIKVGVVPTRNRTFTGVEFSELVLLDLYGNGSFTSREKKNENPK